MNEVESLAAWDDCYLQCWDCHDTFIWRPLSGVPARCACGSERVATPAGLARMMMEAAVGTAEQWECPRCHTTMHCLKSSPDMPNWCPFCDTLTEGVSA